jgi:hypothetical protein
VKEKNERKARMRISFSRKRKENSKLVYFRWISQPLQFAPKDESRRTWKLDFTISS